MRFLALAAVGGCGRIGYDPLPIDASDLDGGPVDARDEDDGGSDDGGSDDGGNDDGGNDDGTIDAGPDADATLDGDGGDGGDGGLSPDGDSGRDASRTPCTPFTVQVTTADNETSSNTAVAASGTTIAIAWEDSRGGTLPQIYGALFTNDGTAIGGEVQLRTASDYAARPDVAWTGSEYAIVWSDSRAPAPSAYFARMSETPAEIGDEIPIAVEQERRSLLFTGSELAFIGDSSATGYEVITLDRAGNVLARTAGIGDTRALAWDGTAYAVAGSDGTLGVRFARVPVVSPTTFAMRALPPGVFGLVAAGGGYVVGWVENAMNIYLASLDASGALVGSIRTHATSAAWPRLASDGSTVAIAWQTATGMHLQQLDATLTPVGPQADFVAETGFIEDLEWIGFGWAVGHALLRRSSNEAFLSLVCP